jgi:hypothetical protein
MIIAIVSEYLPILGQRFSREPITYQVVPEGA